MTSKLEDEMFNLRKRLQYFLERHDLSAAELSRRTGIAKQVISDWLAGSRPRNIEQLKKVATVLKTTVDDLCFESLRQEEVNVIHEEQDWKSGIYEIRFKRIK